MQTLQELKDQLKKEKYFLERLTDKQKMIQSVIDKNKISCDNDKVSRQQLNVLQNLKQSIFTQIDQTKARVDTQRNKKEQLEQKLQANLDIFKCLVKQLRETVDKKKKQKDNHIKFQKQLIQIQGQKEQIRKKRIKLEDEYQILNQKNRKLSIDLEKKDELLSQLLEQRKIANNELINQRGTIRVYCRLCPSQQKHIVYPTSSTKLNLQISKKNYLSQIKVNKREYIFDWIFGVSQSQQTIFAETKQLILNAIEGYKVVILAYGQTGSGKTYSIHGPHLNHTFEKRGLLQRSSEFIFQEIKKHESKYNYQIYISIQEIYGNQIRDLIGLNKVENPKLQKSVKKKVSCQQDIYNILKNVKRKQSKTLCNENSSRSHLVTSIHLQATNYKQQKRNGCLVLIDLAGSEDVEKSKVAGRELGEAIYINSSLTSLPRYINDLRNQQCLSYRESKLNLLIHSIIWDDQNGRKKNTESMGDPKILLLVHISTNEKHASQTRSTLEFAKTARDLKINN